MAGEVEALLARLGLAELAAAFAAARIGADLLPELTDADLKELGLPLGDRKRLLKAIAGLREGGPTVAAGAPEGPEPPPVRPCEAERRQLTVMFVDLVGSTALSRRLDPEEMREVLEAYQDAVVGEVRRVDGFVAKLMGDGVLAYFGWPKAHEDEVERAVRAGLEIVAAVAALAAAEPLACRVGIATGLVVVGDLIGEGASQEEAVVGETPNLAARLQALAGSGQVVVAEATRQLLGAGFTVEPLGPRSLDGIAGPVAAFRVTGERAVESRFASRSGGSVAPMVGREEELALLTRHWREAVAGDGRAVLVVGEAGIGKSRLIRALREAVLAERPTVLLYQCSPSHAHSPFWPVMQQLALAARFEPGDDAAARRRKLARIVTAPEGPDLLASLLGIAAEPDPLAGLDPQERRRRTLQALVDELTRLAGQGPVLVLMEDVHWVDPSTLELLERTFEAIASRPVLLVLTSRPEGEPGLGRFPHLARLVLARLGRAAVEAIVGRLLGARALDAELRARILARGDGVPLYVEELTKAVLEQAPSGQGVTVPATLQDSLLARLDRDPLARSVAQLAACIGRDLEHGLLAAIADLPAADLARGLDALVAAELLWRRGRGGEAGYRFKHALLRDAAYESLLKSRRRQIHGRIADALEARPDTAPELVARHLTLAERHEAAAKRWQEAGSRESGRSAFLEATQHLRNALAAAGRASPSGASDEVELSARLQLVAVLRATQGHAAAELEEVLAGCVMPARRLALPHEESKVRILLSLVQLNRGRVAEAIEGSTASLEVARAGHDRAAQILAHRTLGTALLVHGDLAAAHRHLARTVDLYEPERDRPLALIYSFDPRVAAESHLAWALWMRGLIDQAGETLSRSLARAAGLGHQYTCIFGHVSAAILGTMRRDPVQAGTQARAVIDLSTEQGLPYFSALAEAVLGWRAAVAGDTRAGVAAIVRALGKEQARPWEPWMCGLAAEGSLAGRRAGDAGEWASRGLKLAEEMGAHWWTPELHRLLAQAEQARPDTSPARVERHLATAIAAARARDAKTSELRAATSLARLWAEAGERQRACDLLAPIHASFIEGHDTPDLTEAKALLQELA